MRPQAVATLEELKTADWFSCVGQPLPEGTLGVYSWKQAMESCGSPKWDNAQLEAANLYRERLAKVDPERKAKWRDVTSELRPIVTNLVEAKIGSVVKDNQLPEKFGHSVQWDILHTLIEAEYADVCPPGFFASLAYWYVKGHFPCGWKGAFPEGSLVVY